jgi:DUF4097 and DUF4098 domain-containing protein YvlB
MKTRQWLAFPVLLLLALPLLGQTSDEPLKQVNEREGTQSKSFKVSKGGMLEVSVQAGDIRLNPWEKNEVYVKASEIEEEDADELEMTEIGNTVRVEFHSRWGSTPRFDINVPEAFNVDLQTSGGNITINGKMAGTLKGTTSGGDVRIGDVVGSADMNTSGGDIITGDVQGDLYLNTLGGDLRTGLVTGRVDVNTSGGDITIERVGRALRARTSGGNVSIGDIGGEATISTSGGDIVVGRVSGGVSVGTAGGNISLRSATGKVIAKTAGGDIQLDSIAGSVDAKTAAGSIDAELIPTGKGRSRLSTAAGDVTLYLPENAKATIDARVHVHGWWEDEDEESSIYSDFKADTVVKDRREREIRATYTLNGGGESITLDTSLGSIEIRKLGSHVRGHDQEFRHERKRDKRKSTGWE